MNPTRYHKNDLVINFRRIAAYFFDDNLPIKNICNFFAQNFFNAFKYYNLFINLPQIF